jgi:uncharacterized protein YbjT (DUF2867 family)
MAELRAPAGSSLAGRFRAASRSPCSRATPPNWPTQATRGSASSAGTRGTAAVAGHDAIISCLGPPRGKRNAPFLAAAVSAICGTAAEEGVHRFVLLSALGVADSARKTPWWFRWFVVNFLLRGAYEDKAKAEVEVRRSSLDWTILRPFIVSNGRERARVRLGRPAPALGFPVPRANVAALLLDAAEGGKWSARSLRQRLSRSPQ